MKKVAIVHFLPVEYYPPITNLLNYLSQCNDLSIRVWTSANTQGRNPYRNNQKTKIYRTPFTRQNDLQLIRLFKYFYFNCITLFGLLKNQPTHILYYESYSAFPIYLYQLLSKRSFKLYIHFHEYANPDWYENGMRVVKLYHRYEKSHLFKKANWISQTNHKRLELFHVDHPIIESSKLKVLSNYPPKSWTESSRDVKEPTLPLKFVYVGSLSLQDTYIKEVCDWVVSQEGTVIFDIYAYNLHEDTLQYLSNLKSSYITFFRHGIEYDNLPDVLSGYDIGLILYKAKTDNYKYNASNKLFEYLALNLCVMYSDKMLGVKPYDSGLVQSFDFSELPDLNDIISRFNFELGIKEEYFAENEYSKLYSAMIKD